MVYQVSFDILKYKFSLKMSRLVLTVHYFNLDYNNCVAIIKIEVIARKEFQI